MYLTPQGTGWIEVICGSMFSGKTEELIRRLRRARIAQQNVRIFKPAIDRRYDEGDIVSHSDQRIPSRVVSRAEEILDHCPLSVQVVGIDEAQFFEPLLVDVCRELARRGIRVIVAGLEQDYRAAPFETIQAMLVEAEYVTKSLAICVICGNPAVRNQRLTKRGGQIVIGGSDTYEARCRRCFRPSEAEPDLFAGEGGEPE
ncbi:MAG: thymidine kinase [Planctomycetota bacterium]|nr:thymidine kinase [Planctomycetota bacterium]MEE2711954.1 thymidine kinase [Planctomycetota bacterium]